MLSDNELEISLSISCFLVIVFKIACSKFFSKTIFFPYSCRKKKKTKVVELWTSNALK